MELCMCVHIFQQEFPPSLCSTLGESPSYQQHRAHGGNAHTGWTRSEKMVTNQRGTFFISMW